MTHYQARPRTRRRAVVWLGAAVLGGALCAATGTVPAEAATSSATVTVNATSGLGTVPANAVGLNTAVYDSDMNDTAIAGLLKSAGINALRYPGGSYSDIYNWQTNVAQGGFDAPNTSFANFMGTAQGAGASPIITVNYGTGTTALASAWVQNADVTNNYGIKYWEIGNEVYGNGTYGANWETDSHCETSAGGPPVTVGSEPSQTYGCGPSTYASNVLSYMTAMKAVDPNIKVCAIVTTPGFWPDNVTNATTSPESWNQTVLAALGSKVDCVIVHYYPAQSTDSTASMLSDTSDIPGIMSTLRSELSSYGGLSSSAASAVPVLVTETNPQVDPDTQPGALFAADLYTTWMENGAANVDWWDEHNGPGSFTPTTVDGAQDYGDYGMFSDAANNSGVTEPAADTPFESYYAVEMLTKLEASGDEMVTSTSSNSLLRVHAVRRADGHLAILIDNEDPSNSYSVGLSYSSFTPSGNPTVYTLGANGTSITSATGSSTSSVTVAPYTLTVVDLPGSGGTGVTAPGAPGKPTVSNLVSSTSSNTSGTATLTWTAAAAGTNAVAKYNVYQETSGGGTTLTGTTTGLSLNLTGLTIGASYTYDVVAVDTQGNTSLPSTPVTFTVPPPANASCAVTYTISSSWPGGFGANVTLTNNGSTAISNWTLTFAFPASGETVSDGWDGTWTQSGQNVTVVNAGWNGTLNASGGSTSIGFNGSDTGLDTAPTVFFINGNVCS
ncbi:MAG TPA: cellulose binding domain-containing protein [Actinocrinis sp.]|jgi:hypothetical protein